MHRRQHRRSRLRNHKRHLGKRSVQASTAAWHIVHNTLRHDVHYFLNSQPRIYQLQASHTRGTSQLDMHLTAALLISRSAAAAPAFWTHWELKPSELQEETWYKHRSTKNGIAACASKTGKHLQREGKNGQRTGKKRSNEWQAENYSVQLKALAQASNAKLDQRKMTGTMTGNGRQRLESLA